MKAVATSMMLAVLLAGCTTMLPHGSSDTPSPFSSYAEATIVARLAPYSGVLLDQLDPGIRACISIKTQTRSGRCSLPVSRPDRC